jgi:hypothetical protein
MTTETHIAGELYGLSAHPGDIYHRAAMTVYEALIRERDEARDGREVRHRAWLEAKARNGKLEAALRDAEKRLRGAGMLGGSDDPIVAAIRALKEPT